MAGGDAWLREYEEARRVCDDAQLVARERSDAGADAADQARAAAALRRKLQGLNQKLARLDGILDNAPNLSNAELGRRQELVNRLRARAEQLAASAGPVSSSSSPFAGRYVPPTPAETAETADRDERGLLQLQRDLMDDQDEQLDELSRVVGSTKHIALTVGEELELHSRLLDDIDGDVDSTHGRLRRGIRLAKQVYKKSDNCKFMACIGLLIVALVVLLALVLKVLG